ncbi:unnamed protein product [Didymodactylos carnosus]|uniref:Dihydropteridine reductase n=1 Tax=Didymodactylos carnosus TaxID=1234261 RepID=A0A813VF89_9BILA|nr:unnamed protein product [Didymodactylos carnosus]CAF1078307.1 unnamed protein product [Didymodactylos carnosus]CAF3627366.1 unnamed protein product [Didymodactylos carnosus]CAF3841801.1 unnamed protein product [Didymodactylos carnosus]
MSKHILVYGGKGALGDRLVQYFKGKNFKVTSIDLKESEHADVNIIVNDSDTLEQQAKFVNESIRNKLNDERIDAILNVAGGWAGGNARAEGFIKNSELMWKQSMWSSLIVASLASKYLKEDGLLTLPGAAAALEPTAGMIGYGAAKSAVHQMTKSLAAQNSGLPNSVSVFAIAPITLDTPMNRKWMPKADMSTWTPLEYIAEWIDEPTSRPKNGSIIKLTTTNGKTDLGFH